MCQHSWYDKSRRHYGPKPNTRKARGLKRRDFGIKKDPMVSKQPSNLQKVEVDRNVKEVEIPSRMSVLKRYIKMYNWYVQHYAKFPDRKICVEHTAVKFEASEATVKKAIAVCKYILATTPTDE